MKKSFNKKEYMKQYRKMHKKNIKEYRKKHLLKNKAKIVKQLIKYRQTHKIEIKKYREKHKKEQKDYFKNYYKKYKNKMKLIMKKWYLKNRNKIKKYLLENKDKINERQRKYLKFKKCNDMNFKIACNLRIRLNQVLKKNSKSKNTIKLLGCSIEQLREHLQKQFTKGMNWKNYGLWHIDHIRPCASFDLSIPEEQHKCFNWQNLQPLWAKENLSKGKK